MSHLLIVRLRCRLRQASAFASSSRPTLSNYGVVCRSARNLSYQDKLPVEGQAEELLQMKGQDLIGVPLKVMSQLTMLLTEALGMSLLGTLIS